MQEVRRQRLAAAIQAELAQVIAREVKDPRVPPLTITSVLVTQDGGQATVSVAILGGSDAVINGVPTLSEGAAKKRMSDCITGLASSGGYLRRHLARILTVRHIPTLIFREDRGYENVSRVNELLKQITPGEPSKPDSQ